MPNAEKSNIKGTFPGQVDDRKRRKGKSYPAPPSQGYYPNRPNRVERYKNTKLDKSNIKAPKTVNTINGKFTTYTSVDQLYVDSDD